jgi:hypothetical protein
MNNFIKLQIKSLYNGKCAINEKYLKKAIKERMGIVFLRYIPSGNAMKEESMTIPYDELEKRMAYKAGPFKDRFSDKSYKLCYFTWLLDTKETFNLFNQNDKTN